MIVIMAKAIGDAVKVVSMANRTGLIVGMAESMAKATSVIMVSDAIMGKAISPP